MIDLIVSHIYQTANIYITQSAIIVPKFQLIITFMHNRIICVGGVYMIRSVPHPVISVEYQLIGSMLVVLVLYQ